MTDADLCVLGDLLARVLARHDTWYLHQDSGRLEMRFDDYGWEITEAEWTVLASVAEGGRPRAGRLG